LAGRNLRLGARGSPPDGLEPWHNIFAHPRICQGGRVAEAEQFLGPLPFIHFDVRMLGKSGSNPPIGIFEEVTALKVRYTHARIQQQVREGLCPLRQAPIQVLALD
jgi:hypothetical protein